MKVVGEEYLQLMSTDESFGPWDGSADVSMYSSVTRSRMKTSADSMYWTANLLSIIRFHNALHELLSKESPNIIIEIRPSGALAGPMTNILQSLPSMGDTAYHCSWFRGAHAAKSLLNVASHLFCAGAPIDLSQVNGYSIDSAKTIVGIILSSVLKFGE